MLDMLVIARKTSKSEIWVQRTPHMALLAFRTKFLAPSRTYPNGRMSKLKCFKDPVIKDIIENGFNVRVLRWVVCATFPDIAHIVIHCSEFPNTMAQVAEGKAWYQNLLRITNEAKKVW